MNSDFEEIIPRRNSYSYKWDSSPNPLMIPMWVADMDFRTAPPIIDALARRVQHGVFGYTKVPDSYYNAVIGWFKRRYNLAVERSNILYTTGVVPAISAIIKALTAPGENVIVQTPVYNCFFSSIRNNGCNIVTNELIYADGQYSIDFEDLELKAANANTKMLLLCNPHNPVGRVWSKEELVRICEICQRHKIMIVSDEIHCELTFNGHSHASLATLSEAFLPHMVICTSPSKAFNLAGLQVANIFAFDPAVLTKIDKALNINEVCEISPFAVEALIAAYSEPESERWLEGLKAYLWSNYLHLQEFFLRNFPQLNITPLQATYLVWIRCAPIPLSSAELSKRLQENGDVWINEGSIYGTAGEDFIRINIACPSTILQQGLARIKKEFDILLNSMPI